MLSSIRTVNDVSVGRFANLDGHSTILQRRKRFHDEKHAIVESTIARPKEPKARQPAFTNVIGTNQPIRYAWTTDGTYWWVKDKSWSLWLRFSSELGISPMEGWEAAIAVIVYAIVALLIFITLLKLPSYSVYTFRRLSYYLTGFDNSS
ncbi:uncharacterized protein FA14DRAFT_155044 [Meira miltonrushii]|uniref:Uncharacterized protein n=1 Tax=Meira miltonrushii TaxID=1280837 RepID=A0A316VH22_9BASI|nr:uncharacterized protein FA14DRAFT_155044 [Meira miltonrushii]PWN35633.1 hypothetical protein FA14DRAFT_155044 [Meira miltonrushii]